MKILNRFNLLDQNLNLSNISDWRILIQHPNTSKLNNSEDAEIVNESPTKGGNFRVQYGDQLIPLYCAMLGLVIICLIAYVIYKFWKQKTNSLPCTAIASKGSSGNSLRIPKYSPCKSDNKEMAALVNFPEGVKATNLEQFLMNQQLHFLPEDQIEAIVFSLSDESSGVGWVQLAQYYNVKHEEIELMLKSNNKIDAIRKFLNKWSENPNHNLKKLVKSLHEISRPDTAFLIKSSLRKFTQRDNVNNNNFNKETNNNLLLCESQNNDAKVFKI